MKFLRRLGLAVATVVIAVIVLFLTSPIGCARAAAGPQPPPPVGSVDVVDAHANQILQAAHAFMHDLSTDVQSGKLQLSDALRQQVNKVNHALNVADAAEQGYHNAGGGDAAALNAAVAAAEAALTPLQGALGYAIR